MVDRKPKLLVVDDETDMLDFLERVFRLRYRVKRASSGMEALACLEHERFDVLVTDHKMPEITGVELLEKIRGRYPRMARVLLSGFADLPEIQRAVERCGVQSFVTKPVDSDRLFEALSEAAAQLKGTRPSHG